MVLRRLDITPSTITLVDIGDTVQLVVSGVYSDGHIDNLTAAEAGTTYESGSEEVFTVDENGLVTAAGEGEATIIVRNESVSATVNGVVDPSSSGPLELKSLKATPAAFTLSTAGASQQLSVIGVFDGGLESNLTLAATGTTYATSDSSVAVVSDEGLVTEAGQNGVATVTIRNGNIQQTVAVTVEVDREPTTPPPCDDEEVTIDHIAIISQSLVVTEGEAIQLAVQGVACDGQTLDHLESDGETAFESSAPTIATVDQNGLVTAVSEGSVTITATRGGLTAQVSLTVQPADPGGGQDLPGDDENPEIRGCGGAMCGAFGLMDFLLFSLAFGSLKGVARRGGRAPRRAG